MEQAKSDSNGKQWTPTCAAELKPVLQQFCVGFSFFNFQFEALLYAQNGFTKNQTVLS